MAFTVNAEFTLLSDQLVDHASGQKDLLDRDTMAASLATLVRSSKTAAPFTLAIYGEWGSGKSSVLRQMANAFAAAPDVEMVWFNAWTANSADTLESLIKAVLERLDPRTLGRLARSVDRATGLGAWARVAARGLAGMLGLHHLVDGIWQKLAVDARTRSDAQAQLREALHSWTSRDGRTPDGRMIVVFIDDLDRCSPEVVQNVCTAMKLYLSVPGLVFILGCDRATVEDVVAEPDFATSGPGRHYLEKIIQASYTIPTPTDGQVARLIAGYAEDSGTQQLFQGYAAEAVARHAGRNPRRIKRLINSFAIEYHLDEEWRQLGAKALVRVILLQEFYPSFLALLARVDVPDPIDEVIDYLAVRRAVAGGEEADEVQQVRIGRCLKKYGIDPDARGEPSVAGLDRIEGQLPEEYVRLSRDRTFVGLVEELAGYPADRELRSKLRRRQAYTDQAAAPTPGVVASGGVGDFEHQWYQQSSRKDSLFEHIDLRGIRVLWLTSRTNADRLFLASLVGRGAEVTRIGDVQAAVGFLAENLSPHVLVTNLNRGEDDPDGGFDDIVQLREAGYDGPVLVYTGFVNRNRRVRAKKLGVEVTDRPTSVEAWIIQHAR